MTEIRNMKGTELSACRCGTWFSHWKKFSKQYTDFCVVEGCHNTDILGAHVQTVESDDSSWYVVPLCRDHIKSTETLRIVEKCKLVSTDKSCTCEKN